MLQLEERAAYMIACVTNAHGHYLLALRYFFFMHTYRALSLLPACICSFPHILPEQHQWTHTMHSCQVQLSIKGKRLTEHFAVTCSKVIKSTKE